MTKQMSGNCDLDDALAQQELVRSQNPAGPWFAIRSGLLYWNAGARGFGPPRMATWYASMNDAYDASLRDERLGGVPGWVVMEVRS